MVTPRLLPLSLLFATATIAQTVNTTSTASTATVIVSPPSRPIPPPPLPPAPNDNGGLLPGNYYTVGPGAVYFPPCPPILGAPADTGLPNPRNAASPADSGPRDQLVIGPGGRAISVPAPARPYPRERYPAELIDHAGTPYFMAYGQLVESKWPISRQRQQVIDQSLTLRRSLLDALHTELAAAHAAASAETTRRLEQLACAQASLLSELERGAEAIRVDLTSGGFIKTTATDPTEAPSTPIDPGLSPSLDRALARLSAAHFHAGLSLEQRALLEEMGLEAWLADRGPAPADAVFFWPAGVRVRFPATLPPDLARNLADFQQRKAALKDALQAALARGQTYFRESRRTADYARLAADQASGFAALDTLAEQIRRALAALPDAPPLPDDLARRAGENAARRTALQHELYTRLNDFRRELPGERLELVQRPTGLAIAIQSTAPTGDPAQRRATLDRLRAFSADISARFAVVIAERDAVRAALEQWRRAAPGSPANLTVDQMLATFLESYQARTNAARQSDYQAAALTPGLSPAQRRLLLAAARVSFLQEIMPPLPAR